MIPHILEELSPRIDWLPFAITMPPRDPEDDEEDEEEDDDEENPSDEPPAVREPDED